MVTPLIPCLSRFSCSLRKIQSIRKAPIRYQKHKSTWQAEDLTTLGFAVEVDAKFHPDEPGKAVIYAVWEKK